MRLLIIIIASIVWIMLEYMFCSLVMLNCCLIQVNGSLPEKVIVYRDGVGDGDMKIITDFEIPQFFEGFSMFGKMMLLILQHLLFVHSGADYKPKFSVVVVQKRVNARVMRVQQVIIIYCDI